MEKIKINSIEENESPIEELVKNFEDAMSGNNLAEAERILHEEIREQKGEKWFEEKQRELQNFYYAEKDYDGVKRIIEKTKNPHSQKGRIQKYEAETGNKYEGEKLEIDKNKEKSAEVIDSKTFQDAIDTGEFEMAQEWINKIKENGYKGLPPEEVDRIIRHRESELVKAKQNAKNVK